MFKIQDLTNKPLEHTPPCHKWRFPSWSPGGMFQRFVNWILDKNHAFNNELEKWLGKMTRNHDVHRPTLGVWGVCTGKTKQKRSCPFCSFKKPSCFPTIISTHCPFADAKNVQEVFISPKKRWGKTNASLFPSDEVTEVVRNSSWPGTHDTSWGSGRYMRWPCWWKNLQNLFTNWWYPLQAILQL